MKKAMAMMMVAAMTVSMFTGCSGGDKRLDTIKEKGKIVLATSPDFAPMEFENIGKSGEKEYVGSDIELAKYIADKLGVELVIEAMDFNAVQAAVSSGSADMGISGFAATPDRAESMELSDAYNKSTDETGQGLLIMQDKAAEYTTAESFSGKKVAAQSGSLQYNLVTGQLPEDVTIEMIGSLNDGILMLQTGKVDAIAVSGDNGELFAQNYDNIQMSDFYFDYSSEGNVVMMKKGEKKLAEEINKIIAELNETDLYQQWSDEATELAKSLGLDVE